MANGRKSGFQILLPTKSPNFLQVEILPIKIAHAALIATLPFHHRDPFDRLLVAQALTEKIPIISGDGVLDAYSVIRHW